MLHVSLGKVTNVHGGGVVPFFFFLDKQRSGRQCLVSGPDGQIFCPTEVLNKEVCCKFRDVTPEPAFFGLSLLGTLFWGVRPGVRV